MSFVNVTLPERERFMKQTNGCHIPGYTGHCPTLKFRFGKRYGANTKEIIDELRDISPVKFTKPYKHGEPWSNVFKETKREKSEEFDPIVHTSLPIRPFILGYTGFIPGLNFEYGIPFNNAANKSVMKFKRKLAEEEKHRQSNRLQFLNTRPKMCCARSRDEVTRLFNDNTSSFYKTDVPPVTPELPPLAGYTGHIPGVKGNEASLSQRYNSAAKAGLAMVRAERNRRNSINLAKEAVSNAIMFSRST
ncbi:hypothetical protein RUM44_009794 [Polyplax serrata]|uniref:Ciliary microtubule inner protein 2A-C-like domain-containing protein n=1 Tax=Polyplax serrata TaxID=468196 RepID=A0ABR1AVF3_POLSC